MQAQKHLRICAYLIALIGYLSVTLTEYFSAIWPPVGIAAITAAWFYEGPTRRRDSYKRIWLALGACAILFFPFDIVLTSSLLVPAVRLTLIAQAYFLFNRKTQGGYRRIFLVSFAQLLAATNLTTDLIFAVLLTAFCAVSAYGILLVYLIRTPESEEDVAPLNESDQKAPQGLLLASIVLALITVPPTLVFFYGMPRLQYAVVARGNLSQTLEQIQRARELIGFTKTVELGTFGRIQEDQTLALRVELPAVGGPLNKPLKWRGGSLNIYDGAAWSSSRDFFTHYNGRKWETSSKNSGILFPRKDNLFILDEDYAEYSKVEELDADPKLLKQVYYLEIPYSDTIFTTGYSAAIQGPFTSYGLGRDFNGSLFTYNRQALPELISYTVYSRVDEPTEEVLRKVPQETFDDLINNEGYGDYVRTNFIQVPTSLNPRVKELAMEITGNAKTPLDKVLAIETFLENNYRYSLDLKAPVTDDPLSDFLFTTRTGHCEYFATAMTIMVRVLNMPARLAKGFQTGQWNEDGGFYEVRQRDAHAWVEVYFPDYGWITFDPSPRSAADEYFEAQRSAFARWVSKKTLFMRLQWRRYVVGYNETSRSKLFEEIKKLFFNGPALAVGFAGRLLLAASRLIVSWGAAGIFIVALLTGAAYALRNKLNLPHIPWLARRARARKPGAVFYERMLRVLRKRKISKPAFLTPLEFLKSPAVAEHPMYGDIETVTSLYYRVRFGGENLGEQEATTINDIIRKLRRSNGHIHTQPAERS
jgi:transglutaminase-like putative cysteine protease